MHFMILIFISLTGTTWGRLETNLDSKKTPASNRSQASNFVENCIAGIIKSRPELAAQAAEICSRLADKKTDQPKTAARTLEDCMRMMSQFSVEKPTAISLCGKIVADLNPKKPQRHAEAKTVKDEDEQGAY